MSQMKLLFRKSVFIQKEVILTELFNCDCIILVSMLMSIGT